MLLPGLSRAAENVIDDQDHKRSGRHQYFTNVWSETTSNMCASFHINHMANCNVKKNFFDPKEGKFTQLQQQKYSTGG